MRAQIRVHMFRLATDRFLNSSKDWEVWLIAKFPILFAFF